MFALIKCPAWLQELKGEAGIVTKPGEAMKNVGRSDANLSGS